MDKPEYCYTSPAGLKAIGLEPVIFWHTCGSVDATFRIIYNEAGEVIRLERVET